MSSIEEWDEPDTCQRKSPPQLSDQFGKWFERRASANLDMLPSSVLPPTEGRDSSLHLSPMFTERLARNIETLGGAKFMFLTHKDDVANHEKWSERLRCKRILHSGDVEILTANVEMLLQGEGPWNIGSDFELIYTPGHTKGSVCLYYKPLKALFTGDHLAQSEGADLSFCEMYNKQSVKLQLKSIRKLLDINFEWILPGHGRRIKFRDYKEKNTVLESFLARKEPLYS